MSAKKLVALLSLPVMLAACEPVTETTVTVPAGSEVAVPDKDTVVVTPPARPDRADAATDTCGASNYRNLIGQKSPAISLPAGTAFRHYRTGDPVTMDYRAERINFEYDRTGKLVSVTCG